jgi:arabinose-5-phosphate isomerase
MIDILKECLRKEAEALIEVSQNIDESFIEFSEEIAECKGKIFFTGVGKSFLVGSKIAGTFSSIGISSIPLNPLSILHGDLGALNENDIVIALSNSGETDILKDALKCIHSLGVKTLAITGNKASSIARMAVKSIEVKTTECGPFGLVPSSSTTAMMAMGDAIACLLINLKRLTIDDFYKNHPGGELSKL